MSEHVWVRDGIHHSTRPAEVPARTALELLRAHHEYASDFRNHVATNETYWFECDNVVSGPYRRWYWDSDLRRQTAKALETAARADAAQPDAPAEKQT